MPFHFALQVEDAKQLCPPGLTFENCPARLDCYVRCSAAQALTWYEVAGSPYGGHAYCEEFPRTPVTGTVPQYWAQVCVCVLIVWLSHLSVAMLCFLHRTLALDTRLVWHLFYKLRRHDMHIHGYAKITVAALAVLTGRFTLTLMTYWQNHDGSDDVYGWTQVGQAAMTGMNYDNIYQAMLTVFVLITADGYDVYMKEIMVEAGPWLGSLYVIVVMVVGIFMILNLFLAMLLSNLDQLEEVSLFCTGGVVQPRREMEIVEERGGEECSQSAARRRALQAAAILYSSYVLCTQYIQRDEASMLVLSPASLCTQCAPEGQPLDYVIRG